MSLESHNGWHYLRDNHGTSCPSNIIVFDTETQPVELTDNIYPQKHKLKIGVAKAFRFDKLQATRCEYATFENANSFHSFVDSRLDRKKPLWVFAHNLGFDLSIVGFWEMLQADEYALELSGGEVVVDENGKEKRKKTKIGVAVLADPPTYLQVWRNGFKIHFCDTLNWLRASLKDIGEQIGRTKGRMPTYCEFTNKWEEYCRQDVEITSDAVMAILRLVKEGDLGNFRPTAPGQAFQCYRHRFMPKDARPLVHRDRNALQIEREAYFGGRCEMFYQGHCVAKGADDYPTRNGEDKTPRINARVNHLDVRSLYPSVMRDRLYPRKLFRKDVCPDIPFVKRYLNRFLAVARVEIDSPFRTFPARHEGVTVMARGRFSTSLCTPELQLALDYGVVKSVGAVCWYEAADLFGAYVNYWWLQRCVYEQSGNTIMANLCKLMLNSLYGKFGQKTPEWTELPLDLPPQEWGHWPSTDQSTGERKLYRAIAGHTQRQDKPIEHRDSMPSIAAHVTSYGRDRLRQLIDLCGDHQVYYCDTDSLMCSDSAYEALQRAGEVDGATLGKLRLIGSYSHAQFRGFKDYLLGNKETIASVKKNATKLGENSFEQLDFEGIQSVISRGPDKSITVSKKTINLERNYKHGVVTNNGWVKPFYLEQF